MKPGVAVMLSDSDAGAAVAQGLAERRCPVACYTRFNDLVRNQPLGSIPVLIFHLRRPPMGSLLGTIGRMAHEFPAIQKVAVTDTPLSLPVVGYLTACEVDLIWPDTGGRDLDQLAAVVDRMQERRTRSVAIS